MTRLLATTALALFVAQGAALAASTSSTNNTSADSTSAQATPTNLPQQIKDDLKSDGYTGVKVVPGSYVVTAKDKRGNPVTMFIGPHSMTMVKAIGNGNQTTGSGTTDDQENSSQSK